MDYKTLFENRGDFKWRKEPPATKEVIDKLQAQLSVKLPQDYLDFLLFSNGADGEIPVEPGWLILYKAEELVEVNASAYVENLPGYFVIGSNGASEKYYFKMLGNPWPVYAIFFPYDEASDEMFVAADFLELALMLGISSEN